MFTYSRPFTPRAQKPVKPAASNQRKGGFWLLKLGQAIFVGSGVIGFVLLFQGV